MNNADLITAAKKAVKNSSGITVGVVDLLCDALVKADAQAQLTVLNDEKILALNTAALVATRGDWIPDDNFGFTIQCDRSGLDRLLVTVNGPNADADLRFIALANPGTICSLLADREADKARIAELERQLIAPLPIGELIQRLSDLTGEDLSAKYLSEPITVKLPLESLPKTEAFWSVMHDLIYQTKRKNNENWNVSLAFSEAKELAAWRDDLRSGFTEAFRVLRPHGVLIFKWNETQIPVGQILALTDEKPAIWQRTGKADKTHWVIFVKGSEA